MCLRKKKAGNKIKIDAEKVTNKECTIIKLLKKVKSILDQKIDEWGRPVAADTQTREALEHSRFYTKLLRSYIISTKWNMGLKLFFKIFFFVITMCSLVAVVIIFFLCLFYAYMTFDKIGDLNDITFEAILSVTVVVIPALASLIAAFIEIPKIIAQYLFNSDEDKHMTEMIKDIQLYDKDVVYKDDIVDRVLKEQQKDMARDDSFEGSPKEMAS